MFLRSRPAPTLPSAYAPPASADVGARVREYPALEASIAARIAPVCAGFDPVTFDALVHAIASFRRRWATGR
jgi:hypothetical protein